MTVLDDAHAAMEAHPDDDRLRLGYYECFAGAELFLLLEQENSDSPRLFETGEGSFLLAFDREERLAAFTDGPAPYAALSGRALAKMLNNQNVGVGLNLGTAPSSFLIPAEAVAWLNATLAHDPDELSAKPTTFAPPLGLPEALLTGLDAKLATAQGLAKSAFLAAVTYDDGRHGHLLAIIDAIPDAQPALARAVADAVIFSGIDAGELDVAFLPSGDPATDKLAKVGLRFDLPEVTAPKQPSSDLTLPPRLR